MQHNCSPIAQRYVPGFISLMASSKLTHMRKCDNCRAMKTTVLCSYAVDTSTPLMERRGCCNHCYKQHKVCGSAFFAYAHAVSLHLPPIPQQPASKRDSSYVAIESDDNESVTESSTPPRRTTVKSRRGRPPSSKTVERGDDVVQRRPGIAPGKRRFRRCKVMEDPTTASTSSRKTSTTISSNIRVPTDRGPKQSATQLARPPASQFPTSQTSIREEIFQTLRDITTSVRLIEQEITADIRRIEDILMRTYSIGV